MPTDELLQPTRLWTREEVMSRPSPVPRSPGVYAWYFRRAPGIVDPRASHHHGGLALLYTGIAPKKPYADGRRSNSHLAQRIRYHYAGNAEGSTLRLTLGCLLADELGIELRRVGSGTRRTFSDGERKLSAWMQEHALVCWTEHPEPWTLEEELIGSLNVPLNLDQNRSHPFHPVLTDIRRQAKARAAVLPVLPR